MTIIAAIVVAIPTWGGEAQVVPSKWRAKFSGKKITVKGKVVATGDWPLGLRIALVDARENIVASASDTLRAGEGPGSFQVELTLPKGQRFERDELRSAQVQYLLRRGKKEEASGTVALAAICPNLVKKKRKWWPW